MKYWFFDGNDVVGPFAASELVANKSFGATSLICPEDFSEDDTQWQPAALFSEVKELLQDPNSTNNDPASLEEEMNSLLKENSPIAFDETPTDGTALEIPKKPSKPGPIEDYFNNINGEDLGNILGIPDPNDNSDMDLAHALEKQLAKTSSTRRKRLENITEPEPAQDPLESTHHVATATEVFHEVPTLDTTSSNEPSSQKMPTLPPSTLPVLTSDEKASPAPSDLQPLAQYTEQKQSSPVEPTEQVVQPTDFVPPHNPPSNEEAMPSFIPDPALLRAEKVEVNSVRARLKQTKEMKDFLSQTQNSHLQEQLKARRKIMVMLFAILAILITLVGVMQFKHFTQTSAPQAIAAPTPTYTQELLHDNTPTPATPAASTPTDSSQEQKALDIVQNHPLSGNRGTLANYLNRLYKTQLMQGYTAQWGVEPLYKNTYIVKYRLTKTRKEPIIYVFQADVATGKLTGALNNISLDLVGKI